MKSASRKAKGRRLQKWVAQKISDITHIKWGKDKDIEPREMGQAGVDIKLYGEAREKFPFAIECKNQEKWKVPEWVEQARSYEDDNRDWLLFITKNNYKPIVVLDADLFFKIWEEIIEYGTVWWR